MNEDLVILIQQARVIDPVLNRDFLADILIVDHKIEEIKSHIIAPSENSQLISGENLVLSTGLFDLYSHSGEPGHESRETLASLGASALAGGFSDVAILPDTSPPIDSLETLIALRQKVAYLHKHHKHPISRLHFWSSFSSSPPTSSPNNSSLNQMSALGELSQKNIGFSGRVGFIDLPLLKQSLEYLQPFQKPIAINLANNNLTQNGLIREGANSVRYGLVGNPGYAETAAIAAVLEIVASINTPVHIMRVSTSRGVELIADAKERGLPVTASSSWMHLLFNTQDQANYDPNLRLEPPLGNPEDQKTLQQGIKEGVIDAIAIDHQAYTYEEKTVPFALAPPGVIGLEIALPILWQKLVKTEILTSIELWNALSVKPRLCLQKKPLPLNSSLADLTLFDTSKKWQLNSQTSHSKCMNTPWWQQQITGKVIPWQSLQEFRP